MNLPFPFRLGVWLTLTQILVTLTILGLAAPPTNIALGLALAIALNLLLNLPLLRSLSLVDAALAQLAAAQGAQPVSEQWHGILGDLIKRLNQVLGREQAVWALREQLLTQAREGAAQQERNRLARDLHDSIKQQLFSVSVSAAAAQARWENDPAGAKAALADVRRGAQEAMAEMRALLQQLAPAPLEKVGLLEALRDQCEALRYRTGAQVTATLGELPADERFPPGAQESIFRIAQEALSNVARHARAQNVQLVLQTIDHQLQLTITDDGKGFDMTTNSPGMGLQNIQQRATTLNGSVTVQSTPETGTRLDVAVPLTPTATPLYKPDHTFNKVFLTGLVGGLGVILLLLYPLYNLWPQNFVAEWPAATAWSWLALPLEVLAVLAVVGVGYGAARWAGVHTRQAALSLGALAGLVAALVFEFGLGNAALGLLANQPVLQNVHGLGPDASETEFAYFLSLAAQGSISWSIAGLWLALLAGAGLGALGGLAVPLAPPPKPALTVPWRITLQMLFSNLAIGAALAAAAAFTFFGSLESTLIKSIAEHNLTLNFQPPFGWLIFVVLATPVVVYFGALAVLYILVGLELRGGVNSDLQKARLTTLPESTSLYALVAIGLPLLLLGWAGGWLGVGGQATLWLAAGLGLLFGGLFLHQTWQLYWRGRTLGLQLSQWSWSYNIVGVLVIAGLIPTFNALFAVVSLQQINQLLPAFILLAAETLGVIYLLHLYRQRQSPSHPVAVLARILIPSAISGLFGSILATALGLMTALMPLHPVYGIIINLIAGLADQVPAATLVLNVVQNHYLMGSQFALWVSLTLAVCAGLGALIAWGVAARRLEASK